MSGSKSYEVYVHKGGHWNIDSVYDDRDMAMYEARQILDGPSMTTIAAVQVVEEVFDHGSGQSRSKVLFRARRDGAKKAPESEQEAPAPAPKAPPRPAARKAPAGATAAARKPKAAAGKRQPPKRADPRALEAKLMRYAVIIVLSVGAIGLALIIGLAVLIDHFN